MRILVSIAFSLFASVASAANMSAVPADAGFCAGQQGICYEWKLSSDPTIRVIASGYEDGVEFAFHRLVHGKYKHLVRIYPVLKDDSRPESLFWAYPEDIQDIAVATGIRDPLVLATFDHSLNDDGNVSSPAWQKHIPAVLFIGRTTQPNITVAVLTFKKLKLSSLRSQARG